MSYKYRILNRFELTNDGTAFGDPNSCIGPTETEGYILTRHINYNYNYHVIGNFTQTLLIKTTSVTDRLSAI